MLCSKKLFLGSIFALVIVIEQRLFGDPWKNFERYNFLKQSCDKLERTRLQLPLRCWVVLLSARLSSGLRTPPILTVDATNSTLNGLFMFGSRNTVFGVKWVRKISNASLHLVVHTRSLSFLVESINGDAIVEKFSINFL